MCIRDRDKSAALAYVLGLVCHFALDSTCHPYVEAYVRESGVGHCESETEFDNALMREDGLDPIKFFTASHIKPSREPVSYTHLKGPARSVAAQAASGRWTSRRWCRTTR